MSLDFERVYKKYPRKEGKRRGMEKLKKIIKTQAEFDAFETAVDAYVQLCIQESREHKYIKHFATFANNYTDYLEREVTEKPKTVLRTQVERILKGQL